MTASPLATADDTSAQFPRRPALGRSGSRLLLLGVYVCALGIGYLVACHILAGEDLLLRGAAAYLATTVFVFVCSYLVNNSSVYDPYWSVGPPLLSVLYLADGSNQTGQFSARALICFALVHLWGHRLSYSFFRGWRGLSQEDFRYVTLREKHGRLYWLVSFFGLHLVPSVLTFAGSLGIYAAMSSSSRPSLTLLDFVGMSVCAGAILLETTADRQLHAFRESSPKSGALLCTGVWSLCRHPNYLGEISFWWGICLLGLAAAPELWWTLAGPLAINALFVFISLPLIDKRMQRNRPNYAEHMKSIPALLPRFKRPGGHEKED